MQEPREEPARAYFDASVTEMRLLQKCVMLIKGPFCHSFKGAEATCEVSDIRRRRKRRSSGAKHMHIISIHMSYLN